MLTHFDHVTITVGNVDEATVAYEGLLGVAPSWRGEHPELGTRAALFGLKNALIELVGPRPDAAEAEGLRAHLAARGDGLSALAFGTQDVAACSAALRARGVRATAPEHGEARGDNGTVREYQVVELAARATRGVPVFVVQRADFSALTRNDAPADAVNALDHVVIRSAEPDAAVALYQQALGIRLALDREQFGTRMLFFRVGGVTLEVVGDETAVASDVLWGLAYRVADAAAAHARMRAAGIALSAIRDGRKPGTRVFTAQGGTFGVPTLILCDPSRR